MLCISENPPKQPLHTCRRSLPDRLPPWLWSCQHLQVWARGMHHFFLVFTAREDACIKAWEGEVNGWYLSRVSSHTAKTAKRQKPAGRPVWPGSHLPPMHLCPTELPLAASPAQAQWPKGGKPLSAEQRGCRAESSVMSGSRTALYGEVGKSVEWHISRH